MGFGELAIQLTEEEAVCSAHLTLKLESCRCVAGSRGCLDAVLTSKVQRKRGDWHITPEIRERGEAQVIGDAPELLLGASPRVVERAGWTEDA